MSTHTTLISVYFLPSDNIIYSNIEGGWVGQGNISEDPLFVDPSQGIDYENPSFGLSGFGDYNLQSNSPCIDSGTAFFEMNGEIIIDINETDFQGEAPDMGAFEHFVWSYGDTNTDGEVNILDIVSIVSFIVGNQVYTEQQIDLADYNRDSQVNILDIVMIVDSIIQ